MKIAVDADDVVVDYLGSACDFYNETHSVKTGLRFDSGDFKKYSFMETFGFDVDEHDLFIAEHIISGHYDRMELIDGAREGIEILAEEHELFVVTARMDLAEGKTRRYFARKFPGVFSGVYVYRGPKDKFCREIGVDVIVEDSVSSLGYAERGMRVLLLDRAWNSELVHKNICRCINWREIVEAARGLNGA